MSRGRQCRRWDAAALARGLAPAPVLLRELVEQFGWEVLEDGSIRQFYVQLRVDFLAHWVTLVAALASHSGVWASPRFAEGGVWLQVMPRQPGEPLERLELLFARAVSQFSPALDDLFDELLALELAGAPGEPTQAGRPN
jgi:hypothetical protein